MKEHIFHWMKDNKGKVIAILISCFYVVLAYIEGGGELASRVGLFLLLPLGCIFFCEAMGGFTGFMHVGLAKPSSGCLAALLGWILLLLPLLLGIWQGIVG